MAFSKPVEGKPVRQTRGIAGPTVRPGDNRFNISGDSVRALKHIAQRKANPHRGLTGHERRPATEGHQLGDVKIHSWAGTPQAVETEATQGMTLDADTEYVASFEQCAPNDVACLLLGPKNVRTEAREFLKENRALAMAGGK